MRTMGRNFIFSVFLRSGDSRSCTTTCRDCAMSTRHLQTNGCVIHPEELGLLEHIFDDFCATKGVERDSIPATEAAFFLMCIYQNGVTDKERLRRAIGLPGADGHPMPRKAARRRVQGRCDCSRL
jgi:hypothetical protein